MVLEGDDELQSDIRFALFHLMASVADTGESPVGARGLSGTAYEGHVFWDADAFVLPFLAATHPPAAGALVRLRGCPRDRCDGEVLGAVLAPLWRFAGGDYLRIAAPVEPGASGGPVLDAEGAVVGIVDLALLAPGGVALAVPIAAAERRFGGGAVALAGARK